MSGDAPASRRYTSEQLRSFRELWHTLHCAAALRAGGALNEKGMRAVLRAVTSRLLGTCTRCARHFETETDAIAHCEPGDIERCMYDVHNAVTVGGAAAPPALQAVVQHYRAVGAEFVATSLARRVRHGADAQPTTSSAFSRPEHAT